jgi:NADPH2:quinone reductase
MRAIVCNSLGSPDVLMLEEIPLPQCGDEEVLVSIEAASINFADSLIIAGRYYLKPPLPFIAGLEYAGTIAEVGSNVPHWQVGDRVMGAPVNGGCFTEFICLAPDEVLAIPDNMSFAEASAFTIAYGTAWYGLHEHARLQKNESLLITGAGGGVGLACVDVAARLGARVIAAASTDDKLALATGLGADETINYKKDDLRTEVASITGGKGVDIVFDTVGGDIFSDAMRSAAFRARLLLVGFASGDIPFISANHLLGKNMSIMGVGFGGAWAESPEFRRHVHRELNTLHREKPFKPEIGGEYSLEKVPYLLSQMLERKLSGKIVVKP